MIDATPKSPTANSYATLIQANTYHTDRLNNKEWTDADDATKETALIMATRLINALSFKGSPTTTTQKLKWPRTGIYTDDGVAIDSDTIPQFLVDATAEYAWLLLITDSTRESDTKGFKKLKVGPIELEVDKYDRASQYPSSVLGMLDYYIKKQGATVEVFRG